ncbi:hypothetical protein ACIQXI_10485 [Lysinibacillus sp. NPDC097195]|uniref:hypothetical protein n=1 Tax=Lysinibacillus sp. NPDC097195 TaxID=3364141 RepID=UPI00382B69E5
MDKNKSSFIVAFTNIVVSSLAQILYWTLLEESINMFIYQFLLFPFSLVLINIIFWFSKYKLLFFQHVLSAYTAFFCSIIITFITVLSTSTQELPPGEIVLFADVLFVLITITIQSIILLLLNSIIYIVYKTYNFRNKINIKG